MGKQKKDKKKEKNLLNKNLYFLNLFKGYIYDLSRGNSLNQLGSWKSTTSQIYSGRARLGGGPTPRKHTQRTNLDAVQWALMSSNQARYLQETPHSRFWARQKTWFFFSKRVMLNVIPVLKLLLNFNLMIKK